ncbi:MAG: PQQ-binding-like beta-propeller repeat protein [Lentisphaerae bacterium]|jgi:outer membrane protein assembly factor BamB|nr:PQQ-binding-like beta-propeller repeat protein [Lentisphaerota bacterium]MBT4817073.1 PQQ-binding-like beta-propeller repeat protein [Lentisphaerota bacterium]MBT5604932.1 PQQ-binding-like beta-propeller repeat protein [Lentisphaerota bacterium]MBT7054526.1 PQQ-binding-like beta-propeller repeat protein [Lentisphaerota bacterium]MBT7844209.1 PQQ-binding-like beta-propeller repeat protein [Lentisphaerota bacterium]
MQTKLGLVVAWGLGLLATRTTAADWNRFRGPDGNSVVVGVELPAEWAEDSHVVWKVRIPGRGWSQPVVAGDRIFVTTAIAENEEEPRRLDRGVPKGARNATQDDYRWQVMCLSASSGKVLWSDTAYEGKPAHRKHRGNTYASETPVADDERVFAYFGAQGMVCYDHSGKRQWEKRLGGFPTQAGWGTASSPVTYGNLVLIQCDNQSQSFLMALDKKTGDELWRVNRDEKTNWSTPYLWKNKVREELVVAGGVKMRSYHPATGELLWEMAGSGRTSVSPVGNAEMLFVDSVVSFQGSPGLFAAIRPGASGDISLQDGETTNEFVAWSMMLKSYRNSSPLLYRDCLYMLEQSRGTVRCFDAETGTIHYQERVPGASGFAASPWANGERVFLLDDAGLTIVLEPGPQYNVIRSNRLSDGIVWSSPAVVGGGLLIRGMKHLYCIRD